MILYFFLVMIILSCAFFTLFSLFMLWRNEQVFQYREKLGGKISALSKKDIAEGREWKWRYDDYHEVSYEEMMHKFWKPLDSFYPDKTFLE